MKRQNFKPAPGLTADAKKLWTRIALNIQLDEPAAVILNLLVESYDRMKEAQRHIKENGIVLAEATAKGNIHHRQNPAVSIERDSRQAILSAYRALNLDLEPSAVLR